MEKIKKRLAKWRTDRGITISSQVANFDKLYNEELEEYINAQSEHEEVDALCDMIVVSINAGKPFDLQVAILEKMGYDAILAMRETCKELESRTGAWNEEKGKWCKFEGDYHLEGALIKAYFAHNTNFELKKETKDKWILKEERGKKVVEYCKWYKANYEKAKYCRYLREVLINHWR